MIKVRAKLQLAVGRMPVLAIQYFAQKDINWRLLFWATAQAELRGLGSLKICG